MDENPYNAPQTDLAESDELEYSLMEQISFAISLAFTIAGVLLAVALKLGLI